MKKVLFVMFSMLLGGGHLFFQQQKFLWLSHLVITCRQSLIMVRHLSVPGTLT